MGLLASEEFEKIKDAALEIVKTNKLNYFGVEHIFLALLQDDKHGRFFKNLDIDTDKIKKDILDLSLTGETGTDDIKVTSRYKIIFKAAQALAESEKSDRVQIKHFLSSLLEDDNSLPSAILALNGIDKTRIIKCDIEQILAMALKKKSAGAVGARHAVPKKAAFIEKYGKDLIEQAKNGLIDPVIGRSKEIDQIKQVLLRKTKNNPVLIGEAGVGKTAVVMGLAQEIYDKKVPEQLKPKRIIELNLTSVLAGAIHRGEFEERLQKIMEEVEKDKNIVLFIDELHNMVGAGKGSGMDVGNILKPSLARGLFPVIGATTLDEYRRHIEADSALERRFQPILINEATELESIEILKGLKERFQVHHDVKFDDEAITEAVKLSVRYLPNRNLPDKAIDLIDEAAAKVKMENVEGGVVTRDTIAQVLSGWTGIPVAKMTSKATGELLALEEDLSKYVIGQFGAVKVVSETVKVFYSGLADKQKPLGVFLFLGPTGVGKTHLAKSLAKILFNSEKDLIRLDMSEFMEKHSVAKLIGAPPGYVGYGEEGVLTKAVRTNPYSIILLDEIEKAHPEVFDIFLQVFDDGRLTDSKGKLINFRNTIIIMTSNIGSTRIDIDGNVILLDMEKKASRDEIMKQVQKTFRAEFLNRIDEIVFFRSLDKDSLRKIIRLQLLEVAERLQDKKMTLDVSEGAIDIIGELGYNPAYGARPMERTISSVIVKPLSGEILKGNFAEGDVVKVVANKETGKIEFNKEVEG